MPDRLRPLGHDRAHVTPQSLRVPNPSVRRSPYGDVQLGDVREVLSDPGRCLNDHCLIRHESLWHFFGLIGDVTGPGEMHRVEDSLAHATSADLMHWQEIGPVFTMKAWPFDEEPTLKVESPCLVPKDGRFWLVFKHGWWTHIVASDLP